MRKTKVSMTLMILAMILVAVAPLLGQWHSDTRISNTSSNSYTASSSGGWSIAVDASDVHITWYDYTYSQRIRYVGFPIGSPPAPSSGTAVSTTYGYHPTVATDGSNAHVEWYNSSTCYFREYNGSTWGSILGHGYYYPAIADDPASGNSHIALNRYYYGRRVYYQRRNAGGGFSSWVQVHYPGYYRYSNYPSICLESNPQRIHMSFGTTQSGSNYYSVIHAWSTNGGSNWSYERASPSGATYYSHKTSICRNSADELYIAYRSRYSPYVIYVINGTTGSWSAPEDVSQSSGSSYYPSICCDTADNVWVFWQDNRGSAYEIWYNRLDAVSGTWDGPQALTSNDGQHSYRPHVAADEDGGIHVAWYDRRDGNYEIYYNWYTVGGGGPGGRDLVCVRITHPLGDISTDPVVPKAVIMNNGGAEDSCYAVCEITGPGSTYDEGNEEGIVYLDPEQQYEVEFPAWTPPGGPGDQYKVMVTVFLWPERTTEDDDPLNNTKAEYCTIAGGVQVDPISITMPEQGGDYDRMVPEAEFMNTGTETATDFFCYCEIYSTGYLTEDYIDSFSVASLDPEATTTATFDEWVCDDSMPYQAKFYAAVPGEPDRQLLGYDELVDFMGFPFTGIAEQDALRIEVAGPNPFVDGTLISYAFPDPTEAELRIYDVTGKVVYTLYEGTLFGEGSFYWNGTDDTGRKLPGGLYFLRIWTPEVTRTTKLVMIK